MLYSVSIFYFQHAALMTVAMKKKNVVCGCFLLMWFWHPNASPREQQQVPESWSINILIYLAGSSSSVLSLVLELKNFLMKTAKGKSLEHANWLLTPGWHWKASVPWGRHSWITKKQAQPPHVSVCVCGPLVLVVLQITAHGDIRGWWGKAYVARSCSG